MDENKKKRLEEVTVATRDDLFLVIELVNLLIEARTLASHLDVTGDSDLVTSIQAVIDSQTLNEIRSTFEQRLFNLERLAEY